MRKVLVEISARHIHVSQQDLEVLCGKGAQLVSRAPLSQPGQFVSTTRLTIVGPRSQMERVSILGPCRGRSQVEISLTEARALGVSAPIRESGDIDGTPGIKLIGPAGELELKEGLIIAKRHIHMTSKDAEEFGVKNGEIVGVKIENTDRSLVLNDTVIRVRDDFALAMHIDTDEANAAGLVGSGLGEVIKYN